jgi:hypothetical protein
VLPFRARHPGPRGLVREDGNDSSLAYLPQADLLLFPSSTNDHEEMKASSNNKGHGKAGEATVLESNRVRVHYEPLQLSGVCLFSMMGDKILHKTPCEACNVSIYEFLSFPAASARSFERDWLQGMRGWLGLHACWPCTTRLGCYCYSKPPVPLCAYFRL